MKGQPQIQKPRYRNNRGMIQKIFTFVIIYPLYERTV
jgi:hypothetical protein